MTYRECKILDEYCDMAHLHLVFVDTQDNKSTILSDFKDNDNLVAHLATCSVGPTGIATENKGTFYEFEAALAFAQSLFVWRTICETG